MEHLPETPAKAPAEPKPLVLKKRSKWPKRIILVAAVAVVLVLVLRMCTGSPASVSAGSFLPYQVQTRDLTVTVTGPGTIKPNDSYKATTLLRGEILTDPFEEGKTVKKDDVLFTLDATDVENAITQAEMGVEQAQTGIRQAQAGVEQAQLAIDSAQLNYDTLLKNRNDNAADRQVKANATGTVTKVHVEEGDTLSPGTPIAEILNQETMEFVAPFHSADARTFFVGQTGVITVAGTTETLTGTVKKIAPTDTVAAGGALTRNVTFTVNNPGALSSASTGSAQVNGKDCAGAGSFSPSAQKTLVALYSGKLERLDIDEGSRVTDGMVVGSFEEVSFAEQLDAAAIQLDNAKLSHQTALLALDNANLAYRNAQDALERAQDSLEDYTITSPIDGTVIEKNYKAGDNYDPSTSSATGANPFLAVIYDMSRLTFDINVAELDVVKLKVGQSVTFTADALEDLEFTGVVEKININGSTVSGNTTYPVTVAVDGDGLTLAQQGLLPGMNVSATIVVEDAGSVLTIPVDAVGRGDTVLVAPAAALNEKGEVADPTKLETRPVTLGRNGAEYIEVLSGLTEGEIVVVQNTASNTMATMMGAMGG